MRPRLPARRSLAVQDRAAAASRPAAPLQLEDDLHRILDAEQFSGRENADHPVQALGVYGSDLLAEHPRALPRDDNRGAKRRRAS